MSHLTLLQQLLQMKLRLSGSSGLLHILHSAGKKRLTAPSATFLITAYFLVSNHQNFIVIPMIKTSISGKPLVVNFHYYIFLILSGKYWHLEIYTGIEALPSALPSEIPEGAL